MSAKIADFKKPRINTRKIDIIYGMTVQEQAKKIADALEGRKGENVKIYDVRGKSALTDFFIIWSE